MTHNFEDFLTYVTHMRAEHRRLREWSLAINRQWPFLSRQPSGTEALSKLLDSLTELRQELAHHFQEEENGGCLEVAVAHQPSLSHEAMVLEHEHPGLLRQLDLVLQHVRAFPSSGDEAATIETEFREFAERLHAHEIAENEILEESFGIQVE